MHQKKSEVQIGKESSGVSSDYNQHPNHPLPTLTPNPNHLSRRSTETFNQLAAGSSNFVLMIFDMILEYPYVG